MPRPAARRPAPIVLPNCPMDTLWEVDESCDNLEATPRPSAHKPTAPLRSVFEDDDDDEREQLRNVSFPLPPRALPLKRFFSPRMTLPIHAPPKAAPAPRAALSSPPRRSSLASKHSPATHSRSRAPPTPFPRERVPSPHARLSPGQQRPVSPTSSASSSDTEPPRTPPAAPAALPASAKPSYVLAPPPPAEWESAIDELFEFSDDEDEIVIPVPAPRPPSPTPRSSPIPVPTRAPPHAPRACDSYLSWSPDNSSPARLSFMSMAAPAPSPLPPSMSVYSSDALPMSPTFNRPLTSPGFMPTSPISPVSYDMPVRPARSSRRVPQYASIPVQLSRA